MRGVRRTTGLAGLGAAILFGAGSALWVFDQPSAGASTTRILAFYTTASERIVAGAIISLIAIPLIVFFACGVRAILREHESEDVLAASALVGGLLLCGAGIAAETLNMVAAQRASEGRLGPSLGRALFESSYVLGYNAAGVGVGILILAIATVALRSNALLRRPIALSLLILGCAFLTPLSPYLLPVSVLLLAVGSMRLLRTPSGEAASSAA